jgi:hypothetical protein
MPNIEPPEPGPERPFEGPESVGASQGPADPSAPPIGPAAPLPADASSPPVADGPNPLRRNWYALASLATVLILTPAAIAATRDLDIGVGTSVVGVVFAQIALARSKAAGNALRKTSIWAMTLNFVMLPVWIVVIPVAFTLLEGGDPGGVRVDALVAGDCIQAPAGLNPVGEAQISALFSRVSCDDEHWGQVYLTMQLESGTYPGDDQVLAMANDACYSEEAVNAILPSKVDVAWPLVLSPSQESWGHSNRSVTCVVFDGGSAPITGSWLVSD